MSESSLKHIPSIKIESISSKGLGISRLNGKVIFVPNTVPGDLVDVKITRKKPNYDEGKVTRRLKDSELRTVPFCDHFGICGGCKWQDISYGDQLKFKKQIVRDAFERIAQVDIPEINDVIPAPDTKFYRNKLEFTFSNKRWLPKAEIESGEEITNFEGLGFHVPGRYDKIVHIEKCHLQQQPSNAIRNFIYKYALENELSFFDLRRKKGFLRNLIIRCSSLGEVLVLLVFFEDRRKEIEGLLDLLKKTFPEIDSLQYVINPKRNESISDLDIIHFHGKEYIREKLGRYYFRISGKSFFQTNTGQAENLYQLIREFADLQSQDVLWDLYSGVGSISIFMAEHCKEVIGIEQIEEAVKDARINAEDNGIENTRFICGDVRKVLSLEEIPVADIIIADPPRAGMHPDVIRDIIETKARCIVYVSCNPATQARDLIQLSEKYKIQKMQAVDMFPHTTHIENVALLVKKG